MAPQRKVRLRVSQRKATLSSVDMMRRSLSKVASNLLRPRVACVAVRSARQSRAFSIATSPGAGVVDRGAFPAYVPVLGMPLPNAGPATLTVDQAIAITETVNSVLEYGVFVDQRFKDIAKLESNPAVKFQLLMETLVEVRQLLRAAFIIPCIGRIV